MAVHPPGGQTRLKLASRLDAKRPLVGYQVFAAPPGSEAAVLLAYSKIWLYDELLASPLPDDPWVATALARYFPSLLRQRFAGWMPRHPLKREIIATYVTNSTINRVGSTLVHRLAAAGRSKESKRVSTIVGMVWGKDGPPQDAAGGPPRARASGAHKPIKLESKE